jgi:alcohol dehydrogenase (cytochrome c)
MSHRTVSTLITGAAVFAAITLTLAAQEDVAAGRKSFETRCARCHGADGNGGEMGPPIVLRLWSRNDEQLVRLFHEGLPTRGMPPVVDISDVEIKDLIKFLRTIQQKPESAPKVRMKATLVDGRALDGEVLGEGFNDVQLLTDDKRVHLLRRVGLGATQKTGLAGSTGTRYREVTSEVDWPTYNGDTRGNRYTTMTQIDKLTVARLAPKWVFPIPGTTHSQATPVVVGGVMYIAAQNECFAIDAGTGRQIWHYQRPRTPAAVNDVNRGVGVAGDRVFIETDDAHVIALDRHTGELLWETTLDDWRKNYSATSAPLPAGDLLIAGVTGGEHGANGFVAALDQATGKEVWRFWTVPKPGTPGSETWEGKDFEHGGAPTWFTGSYDPDLDIVYWPAGNPAREYNGDLRKGDNLYSDSILALDRKTGGLKWHYQFTPHDLWDWDATQTSVLVDATWKGVPRKLMLHASRNGFFYVFDRRDGTLLLAKQFIRNLTWASGIGPDGRPIKLPNQEPSPAGTKVCPAQDGATNWYSPSFNPATGLYYIQTFEKCSIYTKSDDAEWKQGKTYLGGSQKTAPDPKPQRILRALDFRTGEVKWEVPQPGPAFSWGGTLATSTGLVIFGEESGSLMAVDAIDGKPLWSFPTNHNWKTSPMTYMFDRTQYVAIIAGGSVMAFAVR